MIETILSQIIFKLIEKFMDSDYFKSLLSKLKLSKKIEIVENEKETKSNSDKLSNVKIINHTIKR